MTAEIHIGAQRQSAAVRVRRGSGEVQAAARAQPRRVSVTAAGQTRGVRLGALANRGRGGVDIGVLPVRVIGRPDYYEGAYAARPDWAEQTFATRGKTMRRDFNVTSIPVYDTSNPAGGVTITIGGEFANG